MGVVSVEGWLACLHCDCQVKRTLSQARWLLLKGVLLNGEQLYLEECLGWRRVWMFFYVATLRLVFGFECVYMKRDWGYFSWGREGERLEQEGFLSRKFRNLKQVTTSAMSRELWEAGMCSKFMHFKFECCCFLSENQSQRYLLGELRKGQMVSVKKIELKLSREVT